MSSKFECKQVQECNCDQANLHLHVEIENLKQRLLERERHIVKMETNFLKEAEKFPNGEFAALMEQLYTWQEKYSRLYEAHKRVQRVNQGLEDKLLKIVDKCETEKNILSSEITFLTKQQVEQQMYTSKLEEENERYRNDLSIAIQLLQCKPSNFVPQKFDTLPPEFQMKVKSHVASKQRKLSDGSNGLTAKPEIKTIKVPIPTFPPTAMVYSLDRADTSGNRCSSEGVKQSAQVDIVSAAIMAKILEEREKERLNAKHCQTCTCAVRASHTTRSEYVQTDDRSSSISIPSPENWNAYRCESGSSLNFDTSTDNRHCGSRAVTTMESLTRKQIAGNDNVDLIDLGGNGDNFCDASFSDDSNGRTESAKTDDHREDDRDRRRPDVDNDGKMNDDRRPPTEDGRSYYCSPIVDDVDDNDISQSPTTGTTASDATAMYKGPRLCSVRLQVDSNNILLDNAAQYSAPILYKRRQSLHDMSDSMVHYTKSSTIISTNCNNTSTMAVNYNNSAPTCVSFNDDSANGRFCAETRI